MQASWLTKLTCIQLAVHVCQQLVKMNYFGWHLVSTFGTDLGTCPCQTLHQMIQTDELSKEKRFVTATKPWAWDSAVEVAPHRVKDEG
jgi:hypothetical protein